MYEAKRAGASHAFYDATGHPRPEQVMLLGELRRAIELRELILHFMPKARLATGEVRSVEALLRWNHPVRGLVMPDEFIPPAQETSLIKPLTLYVVEEALRQCRPWEARRASRCRSLSTCPGGTCSTRPSRRTSNGCWSDPVGPERLQMEITEATMLTDPIRVEQVLGKLSKLGIRLSIDDFGVGYSSLSRLRELPINEIKIDRTFVSNMLADTSTPRSSAP